MSINIKMAELSREGLLISQNFNLSKLYVIEIPPTSMAIKMAKDAGRKPYIEKFQVYIEVDNKILLPRLAILNPEVNRVLNGVAIKKHEGHDLPVEREFCIEPMGNQALIINHIMEKKLNKARVDAMVATALLQLGTGYGKTYVAAAIIHRTGKKTLWVLPNTSILEQTMEVLVGAFPTLRIGVWYSEGHDNPAEYDIILTIVDSLLMIRQNNEAISMKKVNKKKETKKYTRNEFMDFFGLTVFDEVHKYTGPCYSNIFWHFSAPVVFAMSATVNENIKNLDQIYKMHFGNEIISTEIPGFQKDELNWTGKVMVARYQNPPKYSEVIFVPHTTCVSFNSMVAQFAQDPARNNLIVDFIKKARNDNHNIFVFCEFRAHCAQLAMLYNAQNAVMNNAQNVVEDNDAIYVIEDKAQVPETILLRGGASESEVDIARKSASVIFTTYAYTNVGVSIPRMSCIIFATPRRNNMTQIIGRIERRGGDITKERLVVDIVDELTPLRGQFDSRKVIYKIKNYKMETSYHN